LQFRFAANSDVGTVINMTAKVFDLIGTIDTLGVLTGPIARLDSATKVTPGLDPDIHTVVNYLATVPRTEFVKDTVAPGGTLKDTKTEARAYLLISNSDGPIGPTSGGATTPYVLGTGDIVTVTVTGDFTGYSQVGFDVNGSGDIGAGEVMTVSGTGTSATATLSFAGSSLSGSQAVFWTKVTGAVVYPRIFGYSVAVSPLAGGTAGRTVKSSTTWWQWGQNGSSLTAVYITLSPGNATKFRFYNTTSSSITVQVSVVLDQGTFALPAPGATGLNADGSFVVPALKALHVELSETPAAGTGAVGPLIQVLTGTQPIRGSAVFTILAPGGTLMGQTLVASPTGVITIERMQ